MKKGFVAIAVAVGLSSLLMASYSGDNYHKEYKEHSSYSKFSKKCDHKKWNKRYSKSGHSKRSMHHNMIIATLMKLDLSKDQRMKIREIMKNMRKSSMKKGSMKSGLSGVFSANGFDKTKYISLMKAKSDMMIEKKANMLESIFKILNKQQREDFVTLLKAKRIMMRNKMFKHNKDGYSRKKCDKRQY